MALVDLAALRYHYPAATRPALDAVDLRLEGGLTLVAGASGGGKSTLLRVFNGLVPHMHGGRVSGRALVDGHDVFRTTTRRLAESVGFVFQDVERQAVHTTVERDIAFGLENLGVAAGEMRTRVADVMECMDLTRLAARPIATLSGGERQRVAIAGALVLRPRIMVLDEPLAQLDGAGVAATLELCRGLRDRGTMLVVAEHRLEDLLLSADALVNLTEGRVTGPCRPADQAASLASAPQVVRLSAALGWTPPRLDPADVPIPVRNAAAIPAARARPTDVSWFLDDVTCGPADLLRHATADGRAGEVTVVIGHNGAGKTTLLRVLAGLQRPTFGTVRRGGGRVAYLPQNPGALLHRVTVGDEVRATLRAAGPGMLDEAREARLLERLGVTDMLGSDPRDLSSGQRQRAAIAAVLAGSPAVALLDEPTRGMDGPARDGLAAAVRHLAAGGTAVVVATHDTDLAAILADRILLIEGHAVRDLGPPSAALSGNHDHATQLGRLFPSPGPVTVDAVADALRAARAAAGAGR